MFKKFALSLAVIGSLGAAGCTQTEKVAGSALAGAAAGQLIGGNTESTVAGAVIAGTAAFLVTDAQKNAKGQCLYRDARTGREYYANCPA